MKHLALGILFLLPAVSFAAPLTDLQRANILSEIAVLEAEIQTIEAQVATSTPVDNTPPTMEMSTTTTQSNDEGCLWKIGYWGQKYYQCVGG